jgi:hypothetical protein
MTESYEMDCHNKSHHDRLEEACYRLITNADYTKVKKERKRKQGSGDKPDLK